MSKTYKVCPECNLQQGNGLEEGNWIIVLNYSKHQEWTGRGELDKRVLNYSKHQEWTGRGELDNRLELFQASGMDWKGGARCLL